MGFWFEIAGGSEGLGASRRGMTGERWVAEMAEPRRSRSMLGERSPVRSVGSPTLDDCLGGITSSCQVKPR